MRKIAAHLLLSLCLWISFSSIVDLERPNLYFGYGSNLSDEFLQERLKDGPWIDGWHRTGKLQGAVPIDMGTYILDDYRFGYNFDAEPFGDEGAAANVMEDKGSKVYGVVYALSDAHLKELDKTEDVPIAYRRVALKVHRVATHSDFPAVVSAWVYVGNSRYVKDQIKLDPVYVDLLVNAAKKRGFPSSYIEEYLDVVPVPTCVSK